jgi:ribosome-binding factor A
MSRKSRKGSSHPTGRGDARVRVADEIRMKTSELLLREVRDPRVQGVHFTRVEMTSDLSLARLFWRTLPGRDAEQAAAGLRAAGGFLRRELAQTLDLRKMPELRFELDTLPDEADRVEELLAQVRATGSAGTPGSSGPEADDGPEDEQ